jgi:hypothetical protein
MGAGAQHAGSPAPKAPWITILPTTERGRWAVGLAATFFALVLVAPLVPRGGAPGVALGFVCGLAGGAAALLAVVRDRERGLAVFAAVVPLAIAVAFVVAQLVSGNP